MRPKAWPEDAQPFVQGGQGQVRTTKTIDTERPLEEIRRPRSTYQETEAERDKKE